MSHAGTWLAADVSELLRLTSYARRMTDGGIPSYRRSARTDVRLWLLFAFGLIRLGHGLLELLRDLRAFRDGR